MIKYSIVVCCYDTMLINVGAYVIAVFSAPHTHTHTHTHTHLLTRNYICSHITNILSKRHPTIFYCIISIIQNFS